MVQNSKEYFQELEIAHGCYILSYSSHAQGRRKGGAEGANAPLIFGKLQQFSQIFGELEIFAPVAGFETNMHRQF